MVTIIAIDKNGNPEGKAKAIPNKVWDKMLSFKGALRWKELNTNIKEEKNERKKRRSTGTSVKKAK